MRNKNEHIESSYDYSPNELARLSIDNPVEYKNVVQSNLQRGDTVDKWEQRNMDYANKCLRSQERKRRNK